MTTFEDLRMADLLERFRADVCKIYETRSSSLLSQAGKDLQNVYNFHLVSDKSFIEVEENLKNLYTSFNYAAVIVNNAMKNKQLTKDDNELLGECLQVMLRCCDVVLAKLKPNK